MRKGALAKIPCKRKLVLKGGEHWPWERSLMLLRDPIERFMSGWAERAPEKDLGALLDLLRDDEVPYHPPGSPGSGPVDIRHHLLPLTHEANLPFVELVRERGRVVRLEAIEDEWASLQAWLGLDLGAFPHLRQAGGRRSFDDLSVNEREQLQDFLREDIDYVKGLL